MKLKYDFVINDVAGETVAVSVNDFDGAFNGYIKLNSTGAFIFKILQNDTTRENIIDAVLKQYPDANIEDATDSVDSLIKELEKADLLV